MGIVGIVFGDLYSRNFGNWILCNFYFLFMGICMKIILLALLLSGCAQFTETKNIYIDNTAVNNYVGNPCAFYVGDHCILMKKATPRNPDYPK